MTHLRTTRLLPALIAVATAVVLTACGSSTTTSTNAAASAGQSSTTASSPGSTGAGSSAARAKLAACLKQHGVTLPSRPAGARPGYGGGGYGPPAGATPGSGTGTHRFGGQFGNPKFRAALQACGAGRGFGGGRFRPSQAALTKFIACVKQHGYTLPKPNTTGKGPIFPSKIEQNKKFQAASRACSSDLRPSGSAPPGAAAPGASGSVTATSTT